jgi:acyl carrier protein
MQNESQILEKIRAVVTEIIDIDPAAIVPKANIREDLHADSLARAEIVMALEDAFNVEFNEEKVSTLIAVEDLISAITAELDESRSSVA